MGSKRSTVAVLGGGVGGLTAAHELAERGFDVTVYEAKSRLGGKASSFRCESREAGHSLPAEHGFRFFPGFYRNLRDTFSRIPTPDGHTVADNLVPTEETFITSISGTEHRKPTQTPTSIEGWIAAIRPTGERLSIAEINYFQRRLLMILTSGRLRRERDLEHVSMWEFLDADAQSQAYRDHLVEITTDLVAMKPQVASARTIGQIYLQLQLDQMDPSRPGESVLNGPTSEAWIEPWVGHLRSLDVHFRTNSRVTAMESDGQRVTGVSIDGPDGSTVVTADHYVAAVPVEVMADLVTPTLERAAPSLAGVKRLETAWMNGIQFYLTEDVSLTRGHQAYSDSPWALTSISQGQFWKNGPFDIEECSGGSVRGILSVIISDWNTPGVVYDRPARECSREQIKTEVWTQLTDHLNHGEKRLTEEMVYDWILDPAIVRDDDGGHLINESPLLINTVGSLRHRPPAETEAPNLVLAADYVRTETDMTTMESANEAGRRAVRAILRRSDRNVPPPDVWGLDEPSIFEPLKRQDNLMYKLGAPHPAEVERGIRSVVRTLVRGPDHG